MTGIGSSAFRITEAELIAFLGTRRWFGDKARGVQGADVQDVIPVEWPGATKPFGVARARVRLEGGETATYQLFLEASATGVDDALGDPEFLRGLADAFRIGATFSHGGARWIIASESRTPLVVPPGAPLTLSDAEQSNSSVVLNKEAILKLYRRLRPGVHPDVEVTRFLTRERLFVHVPVLLGTIRFEDRDGVTVAGMMQEYVRSASDGWTCALATAEDFFRSGKTPNGELPFATEAGNLGTVTRALHETLASGDPGSAFEHRMATAEDLARWKRDALDTATRALDALDRARGRATLGPDGAGQADAIADARARIVERVAALAARVEGDAGASTRIHGDYHLGQVLRSEAKQFLIIDFEGEPSRPLEQRRARNSPLRDVAGMLRSLSYAAATAGDRERGRRWERATRDAFLTAYFAEPASNPPLFPRDRENADRLVALFEAEKLFYELQYELDHRPDWTWIPLRGIAALAA